VAKAAKAWGRRLECPNSSGDVPLVSGAILGRVWIVIWWLHRHALRRMRQEREVSTRRALRQRQPWDLEEQIREERLSDEPREWRRPCRERQAAVTRDACRRLGVPREEPRG
jgi:hypothetical protein